jgi:hypothetical protein
MKEFITIVAKYVKTAPIFVDFEGEEAEDPFWTTQQIIN